MCFYLFGRPFGSDPPSYSYSHEDMPRCNKCQTPSVVIVTRSTACLQPSMPLCIHVSILIAFLSPPHPMLYLSAYPPFSLSLPRLLPALLFHASLACLPLLSAKRSNGKSNDVTYTSYLWYFACWHKQRCQLHSFVFFVFVYVHVVFHLSFLLLLLALAVCFSFFFLFSFCLFLFLFRSRIIFC